VSIFTQKTEPPASPQLVVGFQHCTDYRRALAPPLIKPTPPPPELAGAKANSQYDGSVKVDAVLNLEPEFEGSR